MHVAVFADLEGAFGIWRMRQCHTGTPAWQYGRECLTRDVNAVVRGAFDGGADMVTVKDTHDTGFNCIRWRLHRKARYVGGHFVSPTFFGPLASYDLVLYVAIHAAAGTPDAFFPHTHFGVFSEVKLEGEPMGEINLYGAYLGEHGIPVAFVSGERVAVEQAKRRLPWVCSVDVDKRKETYTKGEESLAYLKRGRAQLRREASEAVRSASSMQPLRIEGPLRFEATFRKSSLADAYNTWRFPRRGATVTWQAESMIEGFDAFNRLTFFPRRIYPVRRQVTYALRRYHWLRSTFMAPVADREGAATPAG